MASRSHNLICKAVAENISSSNRSSEPDNLHEVGLTYQIYAQRCIRKKKMPAVWFPALENCRELRSPGHSSRWPWIATTVSPAFTMPSSCTAEKRQGHGAHSQRLC